MENQQPLPGPNVEFSPDNGSNSTARNVPQPKMKGPRRRTKTGCLTCRKRRIKCGEERPTCNNCVKSKRECEGYAQRVIFRPPVGPLPYGSTLPQLQDQPGVPFQQQQVQGGHPLIAPRPGQYGEDFYGGYMLQTVSPNDDRAMQAAMHFPQQQQHQQHQQHTSARHFPPPTPGSNQQTSWGEGIAYQSGGGSQHIRTGYDQAPYPHGQVPDSSARQEQAQNRPHQTQAGEHSQFHTPYQFGGRDSQMSGTAEQNTQQQQSEHPLQRLPQSYLERLSSATVDPKTGLLVTYIEDEADDYFDVETDEEYDEKGLPDARSISMVMAVSNKHMRHESRSSTAFVNDDNILVSYRPAPFASPLMDPEVAKIFCHFIASVGPSMSIFERHPVNPAIMLAGVPVPPAQQSLFTYTLPTMALEHQGLLQAMLALSSRHIASIKGMSLVASYRHYHYAIRRISKAVGLPNRRKQIPTLAATLLLGFYEVMSGEHSKWNSHLGGATRLINENDFAGMTRAIRAMRRKAREEQAAYGHSGLWQEFGGPHAGSAFENDLFAEKESEVNTTLVSILMGQAIDYDSPGRVASEDSSTNAEKTLSEKDVEEYRVRSDLYWWYCKQDLYQSIVSGNPLLMPYSRWGQCPPRAAVGKLDAIYGTMDHYVLWAARITDFAVRDRKRKLKVMKANGGEWRPPPGFFPPGRGPPGPQQGGGHPAPREQQASTASTDRLGLKRTETTPPMYGMMPAPSEVRLPSGFAEGGDQSAPSPSSSEGSDLDSQTAQAEHEWNEIAAAGEELERAFGPGFAPLPPDGAPPISTPFGPALMYRTNTIACIWGYYYTGKIILERAHPSMPPHAMMAAGVAAQKTAQYAQLIGRIVAGIYYPQQYDFGVSNISPATSGVLTEVMLCLFFSGVQYTDPAQRGWTVSKLRDIARLTGGSSPAAVATGCETAWITAYENGRGPPYQRTASVPAHIDRGQGRVSDSGINRRFVRADDFSAVDHAMGLLSVEGDYEDEDEGNENTPTGATSSA